MADNENYIIGQLVAREERPVGKSQVYILTFKPKAGKDWKGSSFHKSMLQLEYNSWYRVTFTLNGNYKNIDSVEPCDEPASSAPPSSGSQQRGAASPNSSQYRQQEHPNDRMSFEAMNALGKATELIVAGLANIEDVEELTDRFFQTIQQVKANEIERRRAARESNAQRSGGTGEQHTHSNGATSQQASDEALDWQSFFDYYKSEHLTDTEVEVILKTTVETFKSRKGATPELAMKMVQDYLAEHPRTNVN